MIHKKHDPTLTNISKENESKPEIHEKPQQVTEAGLHQKIETKPLAKVSD